MKQNLKKILHFKLEIRLQAIQISSDTIFPLPMSFRRRLETLAKFLSMQFAITADFTVIGLVVKFFFFPICFEICVVNFKAKNSMTKYIFCWKFQNLFGEILIFFNFLSGVEVWGQSNKFWLKTKIRFWNLICHSPAIFWLHLEKIKKTFRENGLVRAEKAVRRPSAGSNLLKTQPAHWLFQHQGKRNAIWPFEIQKIWTFLIELFHFQAVQEVRIWPRSS